MPYNFGARLKHSWNAFLNRDPTALYNIQLGSGNGVRPDRPRMRLGNERSIVMALYMRIAIDVAETTIQHVQLDDDGNFISVRKSKLNDCLTLQANIDQSAKAFIRDVVISMFDEGVVAIVPIDTDSQVSPLDSEAYDILSMRTGRILQWYPNHVCMNVYNDRTGLKEDLTLPKDMVGIVENPLYAVMNEPNSTARRLIHKLNLLDDIDEQSGSGKLDLIIQLPYAIKSETRLKMAEKRKKDIEDQLSGSKYGIAYTDATEKITQLNRSVENNLMEQIEYLTKMLYSQLSLTESIVDGTADDKTMTNYYNRTVEPIVSAIVDEFQRKFLSRTARTQGQSICFFRDPFKFAPVSLISEMADKLGRNEILSPNEFRRKIGFMASNDPKANELRNRNISAPNQDTNGPKTEEVPNENQNGG